MRAALDTDVRIETVRLSTYSRTQFVDNSARIGAQRAHVGFAAQGVVQVQEHGYVLQLVVYRRYT